MAIIKSDRFNEQYLHETLPNGLEVAIFHKPDYQKSFFIMGTPYGGCDYKQVDKDGNIYEYPMGVAHFLEHKMFEKEGCDVLEEFTQMGANVNAFTSYSETAYYFSTTSDINKPLNLLLDFVQELDIDEKSVEKEKGIIIQELEMYKQMADSRLISEALANTFYEHPLKNDIGGTSESVTAITYDDLMNCYKMNYHPSKTLLVGVSGDDPYKVLDIIKENQSKKQFDDVVDINRVIFDEPSDVKEKHFDFDMDISIHKAAKVFKLKGFKDLNDANKAEWCFKIIFDLYFSSMNDDYQKWIDQEIINDSFSFEIDFGKDYGLILFYGESDKVDELFSLIDNTLKDIKDIDMNEVNILKRRYFGRNVKSLDNFENLAIDYMRMSFNNINYFDSLEVVEKISKDDILNTFNLLNFENNLELIINPKK